MNFEKWLKVVMKEKNISTMVASKSQSPSTCQNIIYIAKREKQKHWGIKSHEKSSQQNL